MENIESFEKIAPYIKDPLVLSGFALFIFFLIIRSFLGSEKVATASQRVSGRLLILLAKYGFILALLIISLGFYIRYTEIQADEAYAKEMASKVAKEVTESSSKIDDLKSDVEVLKPPNISLEVDKSGNLQLSNSGGAIDNIQVLVVGYLYATLMPVCSCVNFPANHIFIDYAPPFSVQKKENGNEISVFTYDFFQKAVDVRNSFREYAAKKGFCGGISAQLMVSMQFDSAYTQEKQLYFSVGNEFSPIAAFRRTEYEKVGGRDFLSALEIKKNAHVKADFFKEIEFDSIWEAYVERDIKDKEKFAEFLASKDPCEIKDIEGYTEFPMEPIDIYVPNNTDN